MLTEKALALSKEGDPSRQDDDIYISQENMNGAIHGDEVLVEVTSKKKCRPQRRTSFKNCQKKLIDTSR